jgi:hypothetical protein
MCVAHVRGAVYGMYIYLDVHMKENWNTRYVLPLVAVLLMSLAFSNWASPAQTISTRSDEGEQNRTVFHKVPLIVNDADILLR